MDPLSAQGDLKRLEEWEATWEEVALAGNDLADIQRAREEARSGIGMTPEELRAYLDQ
jgi:hypothetical protein